MEEENEKVEKKSCKTIIWIISIIISLLLGATAMFVLSVTGIFCPGTVIAKINGKSYTTTDICDSITSYLGGSDDIAISFLLDSIDSKILNEKYQLNESAQKEIDEYVESYIYYYGLSEEYSRNLLTLSKLRSLYYTDYLSKFISDDEVNTYYENTVIGNIECEHILIMPSEDSSDEKNAFTKEQSLKLANEIMAKLNSGISFENVVTEYENSKDYSNYVKHEELICQTLTSSSNSADKSYSLFSDLENNFATALLALENNTYSSSPVETSYGYHIIYRKNQSEKDSLESLKPEILKTLSKDLFMDDEQDLMYKILIDLRKEYGFKIYDKDLKTAYEEYCKNLTSDETASDEETQVYDEPENSEDIELMESTTNTVE